LCFSHFCLNTFNIFFYRYLQLLCVLFLLFLCCRWNCRWYLLWTPSLRPVHIWILRSIHFIDLLLCQFGHLLLLNKCLILLLLLLELFLLLPDDLEIFKLSHELIHGVLLYANQLLQTVHFRVFLQYSSLRSIQLLSMLILHFLLEIVNISFKIIMLCLTVFLSDIKFLLQEPLLGL
jgi:hypothetical protein